MASGQIAFRRDARESDKQAVREIIESSGFFRDDETEVAVELVRECLNRGADASGYHFLFAEEDGKVVGYTCFGPIACTLFSYDLFWIAVHDSCRGKGVGKELLIRSEEVIKQMGGRRIYIETSSRELYDPTRAFYLKCGYPEECRLKDFYAPGDDKVVYVKAIA